MIRKVQVWMIHRDSVLLLQVIDDRGGGWHPITANVEKGEDLLACAKREVREETGVKANAGTWLPIDFSFEYDGRWGRAREHVFALVLKERPSKIKIDPSEHVDQRWMKIEDASDALGFEPQKQALEKVKCTLLKI
jgi:8-oxo-dGTP pyrophosphatase MutT (NUDIX family)